MKYIKGVNLNQNDKAYLQQHFDEEEKDEGKQISALKQTQSNSIPDELTGVPSEKIKLNI
jgi:hypothetical protein